VPGAQASSYVANGGEGGLLMRQPRTPSATAVLLAQLALAVTVCLCPAQVSAQTIPAIDAGARVRVWTADKHTVAGRVEARTPDALVIRPDGQTTTISLPVATLQRIDVSRGTSSRRSSAWRSAKRGALIGAVLGASSLALQHEEVGGGTSVVEAAALGTWSGGLFGGAIGAVVGALSRHEHWERVM
jgi:hypothetical protein